MNLGRDIFNAIIELLAAAWEAVNDAIGWIRRQALLISSYILRKIIPQVFLLTCSVLMGGIPLVFAFAILSIGLECAASDNHLVKGFGFILVCGWLFIMAAAGANFFRNERRKNTSVSFGLVTGIAFLASVDLVYVLGIALGLGGQYEPNSIFMQWQMAQLRPYGLQLEQYLKEEGQRTQLRRQLREVEELKSQEAERASSVGTEAQSRIVIAPEPPKEIFEPKEGFYYKAKGQDKYYAPKPHFLSSEHANADSPRLNAWVRSLTLRTEYLTLNMECSTSGESGYVGELYKENDIYLVASGSTETGKRYDISRDELSYDRRRTSIFHREDPFVRVVQHQVLRFDLLFSGIPDTTETLVLHHPAFGNFHITLAR